MKRLLYYLFFGLVAFAAFPQLNYSFEVLDEVSHQGIPFAVVQMQDGKYICDIEGKLSLQDVPSSLLIVYQIGYDTLTFWCNQVQKDVHYQLFLKKSNKFNENSPFEKGATGLLELVALRYKNQIGVKTPYRYNSYNKLVISTPDQQKIDKYYWLLLKLIKRKSTHEISLDMPHHLLLMESYSETDIYNEVVEREEIIASKISGLEGNSIVNLSSRMQHTHLMFRYMKTSTSQEFPSPLHPKNTRKYHYSLADTVLFSDNQSLVGITFSSRLKLLKGNLNGIMWIDPQSMEVKNFYMTQTGHLKKSQLLAQQYKLSASGWLYPSITVNQYTLKLLSGPSQKIISVVGTSINGDWSQGSNLNPLKYSGCFLKYSDSLASVNQINQYRKKELSSVDSSTFVFYEQFGSIKGIDRVVNFGRLIHSGKLPIQKTNILLGKILSYNLHEGVRIGFGIQTNEKFDSEKFYEAYFGHGSLDNKYKYGFAIEKQLDYTTQKYVGIKLTRDLFEPGSTDFLLDRPQYSSEPLRKYQLPRLDMVFKTEATARLRLLHFIELQTNGGYQSIEPQYELVQNDKVLSEYQMLKWCMDVRIAYGERYLEHNKQRIYFSGKFPVFNLQYSRGFSVNTGDFQYQKVEFKVTYDLKTHEHGRLKLNSNVGYTWGGVAPYYGLFNSKGSFSAFYTVIHNSFETMGFNEFLSSRHANLFTTYQLPRIHIRKNNFLRLMLSHNMGWGMLDSKYQFGPFPVKTMEKVYLESGINIPNIVPIKMAGLILALGAGFYFRYGAYQLPKMQDNFVTKVLVGFDL